MRALLLCNGVMGLAALWARRPEADFFALLLEWAALIEPVLLLSLLSLCLLRRQPGVSRWPAMLQRLACTLIPAGAGLLCLAYLQRMEWFGVVFGGLRTEDFLLSCGLCGALLQHYFELRARAYSPALAEARLQGLQARIQPHFLFNSLNAALSLVRVDPVTAERMLEDLADLFRVCLRDARDFSTLREEVALCRQYLAIERLRLPERLRVEWNSVGFPESEWGDVPMPSLILQPILENAVRHGVEPCATPTRICVCIERRLDRIEIRVLNPVHETQAHVPGHQMALANIRERLALLYDIAAEVEVRAEAGMFVVRVQFPDHL